MSIDNPSQLVNTVAAHLTAKIKGKQSLLEIEDVNNRLEALCKLLNVEIDILKLEDHLRQSFKQQMEKMQKNYYLNEQMRAIQKEMGAQDDFGNVLKNLEKN